MKVPRDIASKRMDGRQPSSGRKSWTRYRRMRWAWWTVTLGVAACVVLGSWAIALMAVVVWSVLSSAVAFWPCPACGGRVGYISLGLVMLLWPFGGWCTSCAHPLFRNPDRGQATGGAYDGPEP